MWNQDNSAWSVPCGMIRVGTCSKCGGMVCIHSVWGSVTPDTPTCISCGAQKKEPKVEEVRWPVIDME